MKVERNNKRLALGYETRAVIEAQGDNFGRNACLKIRRDGSDRGAEGQFWAKRLALRYDVRAVIEVQRDNLGRNVLP